MRDKLIQSVHEDSFREDLMSGVNGLIQAARILTSLGIDVNCFITQALENVNSQINGIAYEVSNLDELLLEAQNLGDEVVKESQTRPQGSTPRTSQTEPRKRKGDF